MFKTIKIYLKSRKIDAEALHTVDLWDLEHFSRDSELKARLEIDESFQSTKDEESILENIGSGMEWRIDQSTNKPVNNGSIWEFGDWGAKVVAVMVNFIYLLEDSTRSDEIAIVGSILDQRTDDNERERERERSESERERAMEREIVECRKRTCVFPEMTCL